MISKILLAGAAAFTLTSAAVAQTPTGDGAAPAMPAQTTTPDSSATPAAPMEARPDAQAPMTPQQTAPAATSTPPATADDPNSATGMRGDSGYGPGWDSGKCAAAKKAGTKTNAGDCPATPRPR